MKDKFFSSRFWFTNVFSFVALLLLRIFFNFDLRIALAIAVLCNFAFEHGRNTRK